MTEDNLTQEMNLSYLQGKTVAIFGSGKEGIDHARMLRDNGIRVLVALREGTPATPEWREEGFQVVSVYEAADQAQVIQVW
jgi:ketol-acid reductoisomerase